MAGVRDGRRGEAIEQRKEAQEPIVVTFGFCGTSTGLYSARTTFRNVIAETISRTSVDEEHYAFLLDGPATSRTGVPKIYQRSNEPGDFQEVYIDLLEHEELKHIELMNEIHRLDRESCEAEGFALQAMQGRGVFDNCKHAYEILQKIRYQHPGRKIIVNMFGHSRGADTAVIFANQLEKETAQQTRGRYLFGDGEIEVGCLNALDQVPGKRNPNRDISRKIPRIVKESNHFRQVDEQSPGFANPITSGDGNVVYVRGNHGRALKVRQEENESMNSAAIIVADTTMKSMLRHGTTFVEPEKLPLIHEDLAFQEDTSRSLLLPGEKLTEYCKMQLAAQDYRCSDLTSDPTVAQTALRTLGVIVKNKRTAFLAETYRRDMRFASREHQELVKLFYPDIYDYYFQGNIEIGCTREQMSARLTSLQHSDSWQDAHFLNWLKLSEIKLPLKVYKDRIDAGEPTGARFIEDFTNMEGLNGSRTNVREDPYHQTITQVLDVCNEVRFVNGSDYSNLVKAIAHELQREIRAITGLNPKVNQEALAQQTKETRLKKMLNAISDISNKLNASQKGGILLRRKLLEIHEEQRRRYERLRFDIRRVSPTQKRVSGKVKTDEPEPLLKPMVTTARKQERLAPQSARTRFFKSKPSAVDETLMNALHDALQTLRSGKNPDQMSVECLTTLINAYEAGELTHAHLQEIRENYQVVLVSNTHLAELFDGVEAGMPPTFSP